MCLAKAYPNTEMDEPILENITGIELDDQYVRMENMFGEEKVIKGKVLRVDFENSKVILDISNILGEGDTPELAPS